MSAKKSSKKTGTSSKKRTNSRRTASHPSSGWSSASRSRSAAKAPMDSRLKSEIAGWVIVLIMLLLTLGIYLQGQMGAFGTLVNKVFVGLFGFSAYLLTLYTLVLSLMKLFGAQGRKLWSKLWIGYPILLLVSALLHIINSENLNTPGLMYENASVRTGGLAGGLIGRFLTGVIGRTGAIIVIIFLLIILLIVLTEHSFVSGLKKAGRKTQQGTQKVRDHAQEYARYQKERNQERRQIRLEKEKEQEEERAKQGRFRDQISLNDFEAAAGTGDNDKLSAKEKVYPTDGRLTESKPKENRNEVSDNNETSSKGQEKFRDALSKVDQKVKTKPIRRLEPIDDGAVDIPLLDSSFSSSTAGRQAESSSQKIKVTGIEEKPGTDAQEIQERSGAEEPVMSDGNVIVHGNGMDRIVEEDLTPEEFFGPDDVPVTEEDLSHEEEVPEGSPDPEAAQGTSTAEDQSSEKADLQETSPEEASSLETSSAEISSDEKSSPDTSHISTDKVFAKEEFPTGMTDQQDILKAAGATVSNDAAVEKKPGPSSKYMFPPIDLLAEGKNDDGGVSRDQLLASARKLETALRNYKVEAKVIQVNRGPTVTRYELQPAQGVKVSSIVNLTDDIAMNLAASSIRVEAPIPGKNAVGIEIPNKENSIVMLRDVIDSDTFRSSKSKLTFALGKDIDGAVRVADIAKMPHLLIAGATGSGKSVCINSMIISLIYKSDPNDVKLILIDPKIVELSIYNGIPHLLLPVVTDVKQAAGTLNWAVQEVIRRYKQFADLNVRDLKGYNAAVEEDPELGLAKLPQIVIIIDELADLMMVASKEVEASICRLAQLARAAGMHLVIATQRPSVDVITGLIKANIPSRIAFAVASGVDSRTILDSVGAEKLLGRGDMLFWPMTSSKAVRIQGAFVSDKEVENVVSFVKQNGTAQYDDLMMDELKQGQKDPSGTDDEVDEYLNDAAKLVIEKQKASISFLQRAFRIGFNRAARLMDALEERGIVSADEGTGKPRKVLMTMQEWESEWNARQ